MSKVIMGIELEQRKETATDVQSVLTEYGSVIKTRIGLHTAVDEGGDSSEKGLILLEMSNNSEKETKGLEKELSEINGVDIKTMAF